MKSFVHRAVVLREPGLFKLYQQPLWAPFSRVQKVELLSRFFEHGEPVSMASVLKEVAEQGLETAWDTLVVSSAVTAARAGLLPSASLNLHGISLLQAGTVAGLRELSLLGDWSIELLENDKSLFLPDVRAVLEGLRDYGISLVVDDFGTGGSATVLRCFRPVVRGVKLAAELLWLDDGQNMRVSTALIYALQGQGLEVTVEGVETEAQKAQASAAGANWLQGYAIARPYPV